MSWLIVIIFAYFLAAIASLGDKYLLAGPPNPKSYSFYVGALGILAVFLIPFVDFSVPDLQQIIFSFLAGAIFLLALFSFYTALENFEASRVVPAIGGLLPLFTFLLVFFVTAETFSLGEISAFILLTGGSIIITFEKWKLVTLKSLLVSALSAFLFAFAFVLIKYVYLNQPFWSGFILMRIGGFFAALCFLFTKEVKREIFERKFTFQKKTGAFFLFNQAIGAGNFILQNWAIALVPLSFLPFINALEGTKYAFILIFAVLLSLKFPRIFREKISKKILFQKIIAILFIGAGLTILALKQQ